jgi:hypothetical protein
LRFGTRVAVDVAMPARLRTALLLLAITTTGCGGGAPADVRQRIDAFYQASDDAGRISQIPPEARLTDIKKYMAGRAALGRMIRTTEAKVSSLSGQFTAVMVHHNTEFERGHALELFQFRIDDGGTRLVGYTYSIGKRMWCPSIQISSGQCSIEDVPVTVTSSR